MNINRKIMMSGLSIVSALTLLGGTAFAAFTTTANANGNTFSTDTPRLELSLNNVDYSDTLANPFTDTGIVPGYERTYTFYVQNTGNSGLDISLSFTGNAGILDDVLVTDFGCNNGADPAAFSVTAMKGGSVSLGTLNPGAMTCTMKVTLPNSADNTYINTTSLFNAVFTGSTVAPAAE